MRKLPRCYGHIVLARWIVLRLASSGRHTGRRSVQEAVRGGAGVNALWRWRQSNGLRSRQRSGGRYHPILPT